MDYFKSIPTVLYDFTLKTDTERQYLTLSDLTTRVSLKADSQSFDLITDEHLVREWDTPQSLSLSFYGTPDYYWTFMYLNKMYDLPNEWPMTDSVLLNYVKAKYPTKTKSVDPNKNFIIKIWDTIPDITNTATCSGASGSTTITTAASSGILVKMTVTGNGIAAGTTVTNVAIGTVTTITLSQATTAQLTNTQLTFSSTSISKKARIDETDPISMSNKWKINLNDWVTSNNYFPEGTKVTAFNQLTNEFTFSNSSNVQILENAPLYITLSSEVEGYEGLHHYEDEFGNVCNSTYVKTPAVYDSLGNVLAGADVVNSIAVTNLDYETNINEAKRRIKVIKPEFIVDFITLFKNELKK